ncbi:MAG: 30S ribosomal protein S12 methylthiotransferase RimO [Calditrichaeota bacterium]|nr:30S ribosomal protein S12 methylthiotransferase RimO [Calditrichota bacterium]RQV92597.1 MAG: 30S ribosomal protein S12 methylthiotransferase RimO [bacterium]RQW07595.1 MAG: 30S ribosomal protein S12 methylthiotransferase RimO [Calditrichota bacterium]
MDKTAANSPNGKKSVHVTTLGCSKNTYDSEILMGQLQMNHVPIIDSPEAADIIIVNTCGFIYPAKQESIQAILEALELKKQNHDLKVLVCGCLSSRYSHELRKMIPEVDQYFGTEDFGGIMKYLGLEKPAQEHLFESRLISTKPHFAYLKISEGCNHKCAFCSIPLMRGKHRSRPLEQIVDEAQILASKGVREIILVAQDTTFYGLDLYRKQRIIDLLSILDQIEGFDWIRLHYTYPTTFQDELIDLIRDSSRIVHYIDIPIQHITDRMLKIMKRGGTSERICQILANLKSRIPDVALRTTLIVGHPGETDEDFKKLIHFVNEFRFDRLGAFVYSPEENTAAYRLKPVPTELAELRYAELMEVQQNISREKNREFVGKKITVLVDEIELPTRTAFGRTYADSPEIDNEVIIENFPLSGKTGQFYRVKIDRSAEYELFGTLLEE